MTLPEAFLADIKPLLPAAEFNDFITALADTEPSVSIRMNVAKNIDEDSRTPISNPSFSIFNSPFSILNSPFPASHHVPWCPEGYYLETRPQFTLDPRLHAGAYYVQEASSMFLSHVLRTFVHEPVTALDLCAAPGGKSTAALSSLPEGSVLASNEIDRKRARILAENIQKWGNPNVCVTANAPADFRRLSNIFDVVITDVPCSGEGMFRKDPGAIAEWNPSKVRECAVLQRQILRDIWPTLRPGGLLVYSTCTFNVHEDEEQLQFICDELGAELLTIPVRPEWNIHPAICGDFAPVVRPESACRFMPHFTKGEGLFMAALRKTATPSANTATYRAPRLPKTPKELLPLAAWVDVPSTILKAANGTIRAVPEQLTALYSALTEQKLYMLHAGIELGIQKGKDIVPAHALALCTALAHGTFAEAGLSLDDALNYLRRENIVLSPETPRGFVLLTYEHLPLGFVKNIGNRCNSLYPTEWRIRNL